MHGPGIQKDHRAFWNEMMFVLKVFARAMRCSEPKGVMAPSDFFDDGMAVRKIGFVFDVR